MEKVFIGSWPLEQRTETATELMLQLWHFPPAPLWGLSNPCRQEGEPSYAQKRRKNLERGLCNPAVKGAGAGPGPGASETARNGPRQELKAAEAALPVTHRDRAITPA